MSNKKSNTAIEKRENETQSVTVSDGARTQESSSSSSSAAAAAAYYTPLVDIAETADGYMFIADLPGVKPADLEVTYDNGTLSIQAQVAPRQASGQRYAWREYGVGHFYRSFHLSADVNVDGIRAELKNGELSLFVPKAEHAKSRKIQIAAA
jgi:HSP20 family protein